jgi:hypothetical protein
MERRDFVRLSAGTVTGLALGASLAGCAAAAGAGAEAGAAAVAFNPAVSTWLADLAQSVGASVLSDFLEEGAKKVYGIWNSWMNPVNNSADYYGLIWSDCYSHAIPPVVLVQVNKKDLGSSYEGDPMKDGLIACVEGGNTAVYFEPWAWQALSIYVQDMTNGLTGQDLANAQAVCVMGLIASGTRPQTGESPGNFVEWMTYQTRSGPVEMGKLLGENGQYLATVKATGIWDDKQQPIVRQFTLPANSA